MLTVSPNTQYLGIVWPTTPAMVQYGLTVKVWRVRIRVQLHRMRKGPSIHINVHRNPNNVRKGGGGKCLVRILLLTKTLKISIIQA